MVRQKEATKSQYGQFGGTTTYYRYVNTVLCANILWLLNIQAKHLSSLSKRPCKVGSLNLLFGVTQVTYVASETVTLLSS